MASNRAKPNLGDLEMASVSPPVWLCLSLSPGFQLWDTWPVPKEP